MGDAIKLKSGIFIDFGCTEITPIHGSGVFIPFNWNGGQAMLDLNEFLTKHRYFAPGEAIPEEILSRNPLEIVDTHNRLKEEIRSNGGVFPQDFGERHLGRQGHEDQKQ